MELETVILKKEEHIATVTLNRPDRLNAINQQLVLDLEAVLKAVAGDPDVRCMVLTGAGRGFCAGADLRGHGGLRGGDEGDRLFGGASLEGMRQELRRGVQAMTKGVMGLGIPTIAMVNGAAVGAGFDLALACDIRVGSEGARFRVAFTSIGIVPGTGGTWLLPRAVGTAKACELIFGAEFVDAREAERIGILNRVVSAEDLEAETMALATKIAKGPPIAIRLDKMLIYQGLTMDFDQALEVVAACAPLGLSSEDHAEGVRAFIEKREPLYKGR